MNKIKYTAVLLLGGLLSLSSCTDNFAEFNDTKGAYTDDLQKYDNQTNLVPFSTIQKGCRRNRLAISSDTEPGSRYVWRILP